MKAVAQCPNYDYLVLRLFCGGAAYHAMLRRPHLETKYGFRVLGFHSSRFRVFGLFGFGKQCCTP